MRAGRSPGRICLTLEATLALEFFGCQRGAPHSAPCGVPDRGLRLMKAHRWMTLEVPGDRPPTPGGLLWGECRREPDNKRVESLALELHKPRAWHRGKMTELCEHSGKRDPLWAEREIGGQRNSSTLMWAAPPPDQEPQDLPAVCTSWKRKEGRKGGGGGWPWDRLRIAQCRDREAAADAASSGQTWPLIPAAATTVLRTPRVVDGIEHGLEATGHSMQGDLG